MIVVDTETTGLDLIKDHILSIGAVDFSNPQRTYYNECRLPRGIRLSSSASRVTGFTLLTVRDHRKPSISKILIEFMKWASRCSERTLAGENPWFDIIFLRRAFEQHELEWPFGHRYVDLHSLVYAEMLHNRKRRVAKSEISGQGLDKTLDYVGLASRNGFHNALNDAKLEAEAFSRLIYGKGLFREYSVYAIPSHLKHF